MLKKNSHNSLLVLTGGGTAGHVIPHLAMKEDWERHGWKIAYIGSYDGIERRLVSKICPYYPIFTGPWRRYRSWQRWKDLIKVVLGCFQALGILIKLKPKAIFSKGGFVAWPVVLAGYFLRIPIFIHESDLSLGLATRMSLPFCKKIFYSFSETRKFLPPTKAIHSGIPIRSFLLKGSSKEGLRLCGFQEDSLKKVLLIMGGSMGSQWINEWVWNNLEEIGKKYLIIHILGKNHLPLAPKVEGYSPWGFVDQELPHLYACSHVILGRSGASAIFEWMNLKKPMVLIPLERGSRGDQLENATSFVSQGRAQMIRESEISLELLEEKLEKSLSSFFPDFENKNSSEIIIQTMNQLT